MNDGNQEVLNAFREALDATLAKGAAGVFDDAQADIERIKGGALRVSNAHVLSKYRSFEVEVHKAAQTPPFIVSELERYADKHSLSCLTKEECRRSVALRLVWKFLDWQNAVTDSQGERR